MNFCNECGAHVLLVVPEGDTVARHVCQACGSIHYLNPKMVVGCVAEWEGRVLLCRRAIKPRVGLWTLPAGFMENGETTSEAAVRETLEEACADIEIIELFSLVNVPHINQVHLFYRGRLSNPAHAAGTESLETGLLAENEIPWDKLAFRSVALCLEAYFSDRARGVFGFHENRLLPLADY